VPSGRCSGRPRRCWTRHAVAAHVAATRYEFQRIEFARTAEELRQIKARADRPDVTVQELHRHARRAERVISIENQGCMAKLAEDPADQKAPEPPDPRTRLV
jgi:hypothetical protein